MDEREACPRYDGTDALWLNRKSNTYNSKTLNYHFGKLLDEADIDDTNRRISWHSIHHALGTYMFLGEVRIVGRTSSLTIGSIILAGENSCMNVAREIVRSLLLPLGMILFSVLLWAGMVDRTTALVVMVLFVAVFAFRLGRLSAMIWPVNPSESE